MPKITMNISTTAEEQATVLAALKRLLKTHSADEPLAVATIASAASMNANRVRYVLGDLIDDGRIERVRVKAFNEHYVRYIYRVLSQV